MFSRSARRAPSPARVEILTWSEPPRVAAGTGDGPRERHGV